MDEIISLYKKYNRPGAQKLFLLAKSEAIQTTLKDVQAFIASRTEEQQLKESRPAPEGESRQAASEGRAAVALVALRAGRRRTH